MIHRVCVCVFFFLVCVSFWGGRGGGVGWVVLEGSFRFMLWDVRSTRGFSGGLEWFLRSYAGCGNARGSGFRLGPSSLIAGALNCPLTPEP